LSRVDLHPDHDDVHMVWNGTIRGFCANMKSHCIDKLNGMAEVAIVEKSKTISISKAQGRSGSPWGLERISSTSDLTGNPSALSYTYSFNSPSAPGKGSDIYLIDTGINTLSTSLSEVGRR